MEEATQALLELQKQFETRLTDKEVCSRRENIRIHWVKEGAEENAQLIIVFVEKLELSPSFEVKILTGRRSKFSRMQKIGS